MCIFKILIMDEEIQYYSNLLKEAIKELKKSKKNYPPGKRRLRN